MADARKRPCCICRRWFRPDPRIGSRQQACRRAECQAARRKKKQKAWRERNPDYFIARRIIENGHCDLVSRNGNTFGNFKDLAQWIAARGECRYRWRDCV